MKIYLATPYSHKHDWVMQYRFEVINTVAAKLMLQGYHVFSPISHTHPIAHAGDLPKGFDFWKEYDLAFIEWCDEVWVFTADGWKESVGVNTEILIAELMSKPVRYKTPEEYSM